MESVPALDRGFHVLLVPGVDGGGGVEVGKSLSEHELLFPLREDAQIRVDHVEVISPVVRPEAIPVRRRGHASSFRQKLVDEFVSAE